MLARMARKKKRLPNEFQTAVHAGDLDAMKAVFATTELEAHDGAYGPTALGVQGIPPGLVAWLIAEGADIEAMDTYERTPLGIHAQYGDDAVVTALLDAGADIQSPKQPALHAAANAFKSSTVRLLLDRGADPLVAVGSRTALATALRRCSNIHLSEMAEVAEALLDAGTPISDDMRAAVTKLGKTFEFPAPCRSCSPRASRSPKRSSPRPPRWPPPTAAAARRNTRRGSANWPWPG